jgi:hypothetical protein
MRQKNGKIKIMNILKYILKYLTLFLLFILLMFLTKTYGDFSTVLLVILFIIPIVIVLFLINIFVLYRIERKKNNTKTFKITLFFLFVLLTINLLVGYYNLHKTSKMLLILESDHSYITLFEDLTYRIEIQHHHGTSNYSGEYTFENDKLKLHDTLIEKKTKKRITNEYNFNKTINEFEPIKKEFEKLGLVK